MGSPRQFSREIPRRANRLLTELYDNLPESEDRPFKLKATFLLSVATSIISVPYERSADDKEHLGDEDHADCIRQATHSADPISSSPFYSGTWRYFRLEKGEGFPKLAIEGFTPAVLDGLRGEDAIKNARTMSCWLFFSNLRNALSHGSVFYLDAEGNTGENIQVSRFGFVSTARDQKDKKKVVALHIQTVTMADFRGFLSEWVDWLAKLESANPQEQMASEHKN